jgi:hypothetical protein
MEAKALEFCPENQFKGILIQLRKDRRIFRLLVDDFLFWLVKIYNFLIGETTQIRSWY